jgi:hypothetical protein
MIPRSCLMLASRLPAYVVKSRGAFGEIVEAGYDQTS